jgi:ribosomal protein S18 acetylase RimI-like enzyme
MRRPFNQAKMLIFGLLRTASSLANTHSKVFPLYSVTAAAGSVVTSPSTTIPKQQHLSPSVRLQLRLALPSDVPGIAATNLATLPENYNDQFYFQHLREFPDLSFVAVIDNNSYDHQYRQYAKLNANENRPEERLPPPPPAEQQQVVGYLLGKIQERILPVSDGNGDEYELYRRPKEYITERYGHVSSLAILEDYRRLGLAAALLEQFHFHLQHHRCKFAGLHVRQSNVAAVKLYEKYGYAADITIPSYYEDGEDAYYMKKTLRLEGGEENVSFLENLASRFRGRIWETGPECLRLPRTIHPQSMKQQRPKDPSELLTRTL